MGGLKEDVLQATQVKHGEFTAIVRDNIEAHTIAVAETMQANNRDICAKVSAHTEKLVGIIHESLNARMLDLEQNKEGTTIGAQGMLLSSSSHSPPHFSKAKTKSFWASENQTPRSLMRPPEDSLDFKTCGQKSGDCASPTACRKTAA
eukprot:497103-Karenia_brevis.AAC.1